jgi:hypothetical protein
LRLSSREERKAGRVERKGSWRSASS